MRIAMVAHTNAPWTPRYARFFTARGHALRVISFHAQRVDDFDVVYLPSGEAPLPVKAWRFWRRIPRVRRVLKEFSPDVVFATYLSSNGMVSSLAWDGPLVVSARGTDVLGRPGGRTAHGAMMRRVCRRAEIVHAVSDQLADVLAGYGVPRDEIVVFPVGVDLETLKPSPPHKEETPQDPVTIICTRRQEPVYSNDTVVAALGLLRDAGHPFRCTLVGGGPLLEQRRAQIAAAGLADRVELTEQIPLDEVHSRLARADIYVSASLSDGTSSSLLEALACGCLPVISRIPANLKWVEEGRTGFFFEPGHTADLAAKLERALTGRELRHSAAPLNRRLVEQEGNARVNMERTEQLLQEAVRKKREVRKSDR